MTKFENQSSTTENQIIEAFRQLMRKKKFENISVLEITQTASIHRITFYYYFQDKYELLHRMLDTDVEKIVSQCKSNYVSEYIQELFKHFDENEKIYNNAFASDDYQSLRNYYTNKAKEYFDSLINQLSPKMELSVDKNYLIDFYSYGSMTFLINWLKDPKRESYDKVANQMVTIIETGFLDCIGST